MDSAGNVYIAVGHAIRKVDTSGIITTIVGGVSGNSGDGGPGVDALITSPYDLALDGSGNLYIADSGNERIRKLNLESGIVSAIAGSGIPGFAGDGGPATEARFKKPYGIAVDSSGNVFIADGENNRIRKVR